MKPWKITFLDRTWRSDEVTVSQAVVVAEMVGSTWVAMDPWASPVALAAWLTALLAGATGDLDGSLVLVNALPFVELIDVLSEPD